MKMCRRTVPTRATLIRLKFHEDCQKTEILDRSDLESRFRHPTRGVIRCRRWEVGWIAYHLGVNQPETNGSETGDSGLGTSPTESTSAPSFFKKPSFQRRGPILFVGVAALLAAGVIAFGYVTSDEEVILEVTTTTAVESTEAPNGIAYPLSFSEATAQGSVDSIDWGEQCDTETGRLAVPDYFAPECMAPFVGDNAGATSTGVGEESIKIVLYQVPDNDPIRVRTNGAVRIDDTGEQQAIAISDFMDYYSKYYELYGRAVELVVYQTKGAANDEAVARADAQRIAEVIKPFAVIGGPALTNAFAEELFNRQIVCIDCGTGSTEWFKARDPFVWSTDSSGTQKLIHVVEFIQKQLVGKPAVRAGAAYRETPRVFGHVYLDRGPESNFLAEQMIARLEGAGTRPAETIAYTIEPEKMAEKATEIITRLKAAGVTTVILSTDPTFPREMTFEASRQDYEPEWLVAAAPMVDSVMYSRSYNQVQWQRAFGATTRSPRVTEAPGNYRNLYEWFMGRAPYADETIETLMPPFAFLMEAVQRTGPNLTPQSLAGAIRAISTRPATSQPFYRWGDHSVWMDGDYSGVEDATMFWWDAEASGPDERGRQGPGMMRFADAAKRYLPSEWPGEERLFVVEGSIFIFDVVPEGEGVKSYPSPVGGLASNEIVEYTTTSPPVTTTAPSSTLAPSSTVAPSSTMVSSSTVASSSTTVPSG